MACQNGVVSKYSMLPCAVSFIGPVRSSLRLGDMGGGDDGHEQRSWGDVGGELGDGGGSDGGCGGGGGDSA